jgi:protein involved in polysaccharide export with SLBB domain
VSYANLDKVLQREIAKTYSGVNVSSSMGRLRGIRVYVTGYVQSPGAYTVNNLSSLINIVMAAGGPSSAAIAQTPTASP